MTAWSWGKLLNFLVLVFLMIQRTLAVKRREVKSKEEKGPSSQGYGFSSGHVWMTIHELDHKQRELDHKQSWALKNWCFWTVVLEKPLESPLDCKEIQPFYPKRDQSWMFIGRMDAHAKTPILWPPDAKSWLLGKSLMLGKIEGGRRRGQQRIK